MSFKNSFILVTSLNSESMTFYDDLHIIHLCYRYLYDIAAWRCSTIHPNPRIYIVYTRAIKWMAAWPNSYRQFLASSTPGGLLIKVARAPQRHPGADPDPKAMALGNRCRTGASQKVDLKILRKKLLSDKHWQTSKESWGHSKIGMRNKRLQSTWGLNEWFEDEWFEGNTGLKVCSDFEVCCQKNRENSALILKQARPILYQFINLNCIFVTPWMKLKHI